MDLVIAIDVSGSMSGSRLKLVKSTVKHVFDSLEEKDRVSIITYNKSAKRVFGLKRLTHSNKKEMLEKVNALKAGGQTNMYCAMELALAVFKQRRYINPISSILLLSDGGHVSDTKDPCAEIKKFIQ